MPDVVLDTIFNNPNLPLAPVLLFSDDFNRPNSSDLGVTPVGGLPWQLEAVTSDPSLAWGRILDGAAYVHRGSTNNELRTLFVESGVSDGVLRATLRSEAITAGNANAVLLLRYVDAANHTTLSPNVGGIWRLTRRTNGLGGQSAIESGVMAAAGDRLEVTLAGLSIRVRINDVTVLNVDSYPHHMDATKQGFAAVVGSGPSPSWDDISLTTGGTAQ